MAKDKKTTVVEVINTEIDISALTAEIIQTVTKQLTAEFEGKMQVALEKINSAAERKQRSASKRAQRGNGCFASQTRKTRR